MQTAAETGLHSTNDTAFAAAAEPGSAFAKATTSASNSNQRSVAYTDTGNAGSISRRSIYPCAADAGQNHAKAELSTAAKPGPRCAMAATRATNSTSALIDALNRDQEHIYGAE
jgi:hypothetical protein